MKKVLITATTASMIDMFNMDNIHILQDMGYQVDVAVNFKQGNTTSYERVQEFISELNFLNVGVHQIDFTREVKNIKMHRNAFSALKQLCKSNSYDFIHTQTPIASVLTRVVAKQLGIPVIYMVHGFHFFRGAPKINWRVYYPIEKYAAKFTDLIITINEEDYQAAKQFKCKKIEYVPGVGVDVNVPSISIHGKNDKKKELGLTNDNILISVGELNYGKNHATVIEALSSIKDIDFQYLIVGKGENRELLEKLIVEKDLQGKVKLLGYRQDVQELLQVSTGFVFPSYREGLSKALMEAMSVGLPAIVSEIRGNKDLIDANKGGYLFNPGDSDELRNHIINLLNNKSKQNEFGNYNREKVKNFSKEKVNMEMRRIYSEFSNSI